MKRLSEILFVALIAILLVNGISVELGLGVTTPAMAITVGVIFFVSAVFSGLMHRGELLWSGISTWVLLSISVFTMSAVISVIISLMWAFMALEVTMVWGIILTAIFVGSWANARLSTFE